MQKSIAIERPRGGLYEKWITALSTYHQVMGVALFTTTQGGLLLTQQNGLWSLPMSPLNGRDSAPFRIPYTVAKHKLMIDPDILEGSPRLIGEAEMDQELLIFVQARIPHRVRVEGSVMVMGDSCIVALNGSVSPILSSAIEHMRQHRSLSWVAQTATLQ